MTAICNAFKKNVHMSSTLVLFDMSNNKLEPEGTSALAAWLANPNTVRQLNLANTNANLDVLIGAILRGCNELSEFDISGNKLSKKETPSLAKYLQAT